MEDETKVTERDMQDFYQTYCPFGYLDIQAAIRVFKAAGKDTDDLMDAIDEFADSCGIEKDKIDVVGVAYDALHQEARTFIETATNVDICNETPYYGVNVSGNYMCTQFDGKTEDFEALCTLIETIEDYKNNAVLAWFHAELK